MKKVLLLTTLVILATSFMFAYAQEKKKGKAVPDPAAEVKKSIKRGKALFDDAGLGTSGMTCNSCHIKGGTMDGKMGEMPIPAFDNLTAKYPRYFMMAKRVLTLDQVVNFCIVNPLKGEPLKWDDQRLTDLTAYCTWVKPAEAEAEKIKK